MEVVGVVVAAAEGRALDLAEDLLPGDGLVQVGQLVVGVQDGRGQDLAPALHTPAAAQGLLEAVLSSASLVPGQFIS